MTACSRAFWRGDVKREGLQRVYAITFPEKALLREYQTRIEEAKKRDHRVVGVQQELFFFHPLSPGSCFFLPLGARVYNGLIQYMREKYWEYEYEEVRGREREDRAGRGGGGEEKGAAGHVFFPSVAAASKDKRRLNYKTPALPPNTHITHTQQTQVVSPNIYNFDLWKTSGHADHYKENMFSFDVEKAEFGLKPMNCPG